MRKRDLVEQLNSLLNLENKITYWQCLQIRKYELQEMVDRVHDLYRAAGQCREIREQCPLYKDTAASYRVKRPRPGYSTVGDS